MADHPVGSKQYRVTKAIHWHFCTEKTNAEIADELGVNERTVREYINEPPAEEVQEQLSQQETQTRLVAFEELKHQLQAAGERARSAEKPVKIWQDEDGDLCIRDVEDDDGELVKRVPVNVDIEMGIDQTQRFYGRQEAREILQMMIDLVGAAEPEQLEVSGEMSGEFSVSITHHRAEDESE